MFERVTGWVKRHPVWSGIIAISVLLIGWQVLAPVKRTYAYVAEPVSSGAVISSVTASGKLRALNKIGRAHV